MLAQILNHAALAVSRLAAQFTEAPLLKGLITAIGNEIQNTEDGLFGILAVRDLENANDATLDHIGKLVDAPLRGAKTDAQYRARVKAQILVNKSPGNATAVYGIAPKVVLAWAVANNPKLIEDTASCGYTIGCNPENSIVNDRDQARDLGLILDDVNPAGVRGIVLSQSIAAGAAFCFANGPGLGFGAGAFVAAYDAGKDH